MIGLYVGMGRGGGGGFTPARFGSSLPWWTYDDDAGATLNTATNPYQFSALLNHGTIGGSASQATSSLQPPLSTFGGRTSTQALGGDRMVATAAASNFRFLHDGTGCGIATVVRVDDYTTGPAPFGTGGGGVVGTHIFFAAGQMYVRIHNGTTYVAQRISPASFSVGVDYLLFVSYTSPNISIRVYDSAGSLVWSDDSTEAATPAAGDPTTTFTLYAQRDSTFNYLNGSCPEVVLLNRSLTTDEIAQLRTYLTKRWLQPWSAIVGTSVPWPRLLLDASDVSSVTVTGSGVSDWASTSGLAIVGKQTTDSKRPAYTSGVDVTFDGSDDSLDFTGLTMPSGKRTIVAVVDPNGTGAVFRYLFDSQTGRMAVQPYDFQVAGSAGWQDSSAQQVISGGVNALQVAAWQLDSPTASAVRVNGSSIGTAAYVDTAIGATTALGSGFSGTGSYSYATLHEFLIFQPALTLAQLQAVESYLNSKWTVY